MGDYQNALHYTLHQIRTNVATAGVRFKLQGCQTQVHSIRNTILPVHLKVFKSLFATLVNK